LVLFNPGKKHSCLSDDVHIVYKADRDEFIAEFNDILNSYSSGYLICVSEEDNFGGDTVETFAEELRSFMVENSETAVATPKGFYKFPNRITGVMIRLSAVPDTLRMNAELKYSYEADFLLRLCASAGFMIQTGQRYKQSEPGDGSYRSLISIYDRDWYIDDMEHFLIPLLREFSSDEDKPPYIMQCYALYSIKCRLEANKDNRNRHVLSEDDIECYKQLVSMALGYIDDSIIMNRDCYPVYSKDFFVRRMLLRLKYGVPKVTEGVELIDDLTGEEEISDGRPCVILTLNGQHVFSGSRIRCNLQLIDYNRRTGMLEIDGSVPGIFNDVEYYFELNGVRYELSYCDRYTITKYFGVSAYKRRPFHASVNIAAAGQESRLIFVMQHGDVKYMIPYQYLSHTSRLAAYPHNSYWHAEDILLVNEFEEQEDGTNLPTAIRIYPYTFTRMARYELGLQWELLSSLKLHKLKFLLQRMAWVVTSPYFKNRTIWFFYDKIYKGGDSAEYMYKYSLEQDDGIHKYYLIDRNAADYKRLRAEGYKPVKRGSFKHRLLFLNADMMMVTNSTVFAFNDYYMENSRYVRGITDFHVVCLQHGLSVQNIAIAQNRLRDNTRLYCCASKYEIENLSRPVYDYEGYDALRLTGIPRYDGLHDVSGEMEYRQIIISPTWRMQAAVLVKKNEGVERDYNPEFRETDYFKVYNSLINDERLIDAAKEYGYRIAYILHPIVSPQKDDFDRNDYVDIVPSVGDMSYEKYFCESSLMVTDYSGIQFDFAYMRKPVVYYHPEELEAHYEEGVFKYDTMAFGEIVKRKDELVDLLIDYMKSGCVMKGEYRQRADDFYEYDDFGNRERVYNELIRHQRMLDDIR